MAYKFFGKESASGATENEIMQNQELNKNLHKLIVRKFEKLHSSFDDNIWGDHLGDIKLISKFKSCVLDSYCKYT